MLYRIKLAAMGTADEEIKALSIVNPKLTNILPLKLGVCQNMDMHASLTARNFFIVLFCTFPVHLSFVFSFSKSSHFFLTVLGLVSCVRFG